MKLLFRNSERCQLDASHVLTKLSTDPNFEYKIPDVIVLFVRMTLLPGTSTNVKRNDGDRQLRHSTRLGYILTFSTFKYIYHSNTMDQNLLFIMAIQAGQIHHGQWWDTSRPSVILHLSTHYIRKPSYSDYIRYIVTPPGCSSLSRGRSLGINSKEYDNHETRQNKIPRIWI